MVDFDPKNISGGSRFNGFNLPDFTKETLYKSPLASLDGKLQYFYVLPETEFKIRSIVDQDEEKAQKILWLLDRSTEDKGKDFYKQLDESSQQAVDDLIDRHRFFHQNPLSDTKLIGSMQDRLEEIDISLKRIYPDSLDDLSRDVIKKLIHDPYYKLEFPKKF